MIYNVFKNITFACGILSNFLYLYCLVVSISPLLTNSFTANYLLETTLIVGPISFVLAVIFCFTLICGKRVKPEKRSFYFRTLFLLNIFNTLLVLLFIALSFDHKPMFG